MSWLEQALLLTVSLIANMFSAFVGGGAGLIQLPALIFLGLPFSVALATHKIASVALGIGATSRHLRERTVEWRFSLIIMLFGVPGVVFGALLVLNIPDRSAEIALGLLTLGLGLYSVCRKELGLSFSPRHRDVAGIGWGGVVLFLIGFLNGSLASGTGLFVTMWLVRWFGLDYKRAVAYTLIFVGLAWNGAGALTLGFLGEVKWSWLPALLVGSLLGGYLGAHLSIIKGNRIIKRVYEWVTFAVGVKLIIG